ncbi:hypothetical protein [Thiohalocapsa marina]|nr:hypothetical protein [Thiohalocapsa marina]
MSETALIATAVAVLVLAIAVPALCYGAVRLPYRSKADRRDADD